MIGKANSRLSAGTDQRAYFMVPPLVVRWIGGGNGARGASARSARDILDERYARGEIDREEYLQRKNDIAGG